MTGNEQHVTERQKKFIESLIENFNRYVSKKDGADVIIDSYLSFQLLFSYHPNNI